MRNQIRNLTRAFFVFSLIQETFQMLDGKSGNFNNLKAELINNKEITVSCKKQFFEYISGLVFNSKWALNMLHSGALSEENINSLGFFDECVGIKHVGKANITGQYCLVNLQSSNATSDNFILNTDLETNSQLATCIPNQCTANDIENLYFLMGFNVSVNEGLCQTRGSNLEMSPVIILATIMFLTIILMILSATVWDVFHAEQHNVFVNLSLRKSLRKLTSEAKSGQQVLCLHGIRALSILGIIMGHIQHSQFYLPIENSWYINKWANSFFGAFVLCLTTLPVQTFFLLSGFLIGYTYVKLLARNEHLNVVKFYLHRYFRLTPAIAAIILFYVSFYGFLGSGPFWPSLVIQTQVETCESRWWMALLYIQNLSSSTHCCISQAWYLTVDMQLYILSPFLLYVIKTRPQNFVTLCKILLFGSFFYTVFQVLYYKPTLTPVDQNSNAVNANLFTDAYYQYDTSVIINATPWLIGIALSYIVTKSQEKDVIISKIWAMLLWMLSLSMLILNIALNSMIVTSSVNPTVLQNVYLISSKLTNSLSIAWIIFACLFNYGGWINNFLSLRIFQVISKLSYSMYLVHNAIIYADAGQYRYQVLLGNFEIISGFCTATVLSIFFATLLMLFVESPGTIISDYFLKKTTSKVKAGILSTSKKNYIEIEPKN